MSDGPPYTRQELEGRPDTDAADRGALCPCCELRIPQFAELTDADAFRIRQLISQGQDHLAAAELRYATGCPARFARTRVTHSGRPKSVGTTAPCPYCQQPLVTALARQCRHCSMDWHDPERPYNFKAERGL